MKALTLTQPWATLIAFGEKRIETRSWRTHYRGPLAIHAAANLGPVGGFAGLCRRIETEPFATLLKLHCSGYTTEEIAASLPRGAIVATCQLERVIRTETFWSKTLPEIEADLNYRLGRHELAFGNYEPFRWAWVLRQVTNHYGGEECRGGRGLWDVPVETERALRERGAPE